MTNTLDSSTVQTPIRFADQGRRQSRSLWGVYDDDSFGIWSCRFSADGNEVIAGGSGHIFVYDLLADRRTVKIGAHKDDVNSCCWADSASGNVLISASDDTFLKVWDRRSLGGSQKPSGVLVGHTEGITNVSAKGDGRYIISNGKDQVLRLWDLRKMCSSDHFDSFKHINYRCRDYDYRYGHFPKPERPAHPNDCSVMTYRGHAVLRTLIRCNFSPAETTGGQYIYSGSADGRIHIWSLDGRIVQVLDRSQTLPMSYDPSGPELEPLTGSRATVCVRDVSWSSMEPVLMSVGWESSRVGGSIVARHEWKGLSKMAYSLEDFTEKQRTEHAQRAASQRATRYRRVPGAFEEEEDDEDD
jgi:WD repeat-containing protein 23